MVNTLYSICPWLSQRSFWEDNYQTIVSIFSQLNHDFASEKIISMAPISPLAPSDMAMQWMWAKLMGHQHGAMEQGLLNKLPLLGAKNGQYIPLISTLHYGDLSFTGPRPLNTTTQYSKALILGGQPTSYSIKLKQVMAQNALAHNIEELVILSGQRLRGWDSFGERSTSELFKAMTALSGIKRLTLMQRSAFMRAESARPADQHLDLWLRPYATEYHIDRLMTEALLYETIDWSIAPQTIIASPEAAMPYIDRQGITQTIPPRSEAAVVYKLVDGRKVWIINGRATPRKSGIPRATTDSQTADAAKLLPWRHSENLLFSVNLPHIRAGLDGIIRLLTTHRKHIKLADVVSAINVKVDVLTALGEIPATYKADKRLQALIDGGDPDSSELLAL